MRKSIVIIPAILAGVYFCGAGFFNAHFLPGTVINDKTVGMRTVHAADALLEPVVPEDITVSGKNDMTDTIAMSAIDYEIHNAQSASSVLDQQNAFSWPFFFAQDRSYTIETGESYSDEKLKDAVNGISFLQDPVEPVDAHLEKKEDTFEIVPEDDGYSADMDKVYNLVKTAVDEKQSDTIDLVAEGCYKEAKIRADDPSLQEKLDKIDKFLQKKVTIDLTDAKEVIDKSVLINAISKKGKIKLNDEFISGYVDDLCTKYETYRTERPFHTTTGQDIYVGGSQYDTYGFWMDREATAQLIKEALEKDEETTISPEWKVWALTRNQSNGDIGNTYAEVSKEKQHMWFYKDGKMVLDADVVTGLPTEQRETPSGVFRVLLKEKNHTMKDESYSGTAFAERWMALTWQGVGFHDASWQSSFGGDRYKTAGSHGCINLSTDTAIKLYDLIDNNVPVIIY